MPKAPIALDDWRKQTFLEWLLTPKEERDPPTMDELADRLQLTRRTLTNWKTDDKEFMEAWEKRYLATVGNPEIKQKILKTLERTATDNDDPKHVQAATAYFNIVEGLRPTKAVLSVPVGAPAQLTDEQLEKAFMEKLTAVQNAQEQPT